MIKIALRGIVAHASRFLAPALAVFLGVAFISGTFVFTDTLRATLDGLFGDVYAGTDAAVRAKGGVETDFGVTQRGRIPESVVAEVEQVDGVKAASGSITTYAQLVDLDGDVIGNAASGKPTFGGNWITVDALNPYSLLHGGRAPSGADEIVIDKGSADAGDFEVGDRATVLTVGAPKEYTIVGITKFGDEDSPAGASITLWDLPTSQAIVGATGQVDMVQVEGDEGLSEQDVRDRVRAALGDRYDVVTGSALAQEQQDVVDQGLSFLDVLLTVFAVIALVVAVLLIYNTFSIIVAQRVQELALIRAIGANRGQVMTSVVTEALTIGVGASILGIPMGAFIAEMLKLLFRSAGFDLPAGRTVLGARVIAIGLVVGVVATLVSAILPARRAANTPPIAAIKELGTSTTTTGRRRRVLGVVMLALAAIAVPSGLLASSDDAYILVLAGAGLAFLGVFVVAPAIADPASRVLGTRPVGVLVGIAGFLVAAACGFGILAAMTEVAALGWWAPLVVVVLGLVGWTAAYTAQSGRAPFHVTGEVGRENARRNPGRTAATASMLMIGVAIASLISVVAASTKASIGALVDDTFRADFVLAGQGFAGGFSPDVVTQVRGLPEVQAVAGLEGGPAMLDDKGTIVVGVEPDAVDQVFDLEDDGRTADLGTDGIAVMERTADEKGWKLGDTVELQFSQTGKQPFVVRSIFRDDALGGQLQYLISTDAFNANFPVDQQLVLQAMVKTRDDVSMDDARAAIDRVVAPYPSVTVQDQAEYKASREDQVDTLLQIIYGLLALAVVIAFFGIINTLSLSIFERTREIGLMRAVGMTRTQLGDSVRWEAVIVALLGTILGLVLGLSMGWAMVASLADQGFSRFAIDRRVTGLITVGAALLGVAAAALPAVRAAHRDVLTAIKSE